MAKPVTDAWQLSVSEEIFLQQLEVLQQTKLIIPLSEVVEQLYTRKIKKAIAVSFDDGYLDNNSTALL